MPDSGSLRRAKIGFPVIAHDRRGFCRSGRPFGGLEWTILVDDFAAKRDALAQRDAALAGFALCRRDCALPVAPRGVALIAPVVPGVRAAGQMTQVRLPVQMALQASPGARPDCVDAFALTFICTDLPFARVPTPVLRGTADRAMPSKAGIDRRRMAAMGAFAPVHDVARKAVVPPLMPRPVCPTVAGFVAMSPNPMTMPA